MKRVIAIIAVIAMFILSLTGCTKQEEKNIEPELSQMKSICELSVMECYYHNVAKFSQEDAQQFLFWSKDKKFWIEYSGVVRLGIDASQLSFKLEGDTVTIGLPPAKVLDCDVDSDSLTKDSFIVDKNSAKIEAEDETQAFSLAQTQLEENAASDTALLAEAQQRTQTLLEDYVNNIGRVTGKGYTVKWEYLDDQQTSQTEIPEAETETTAGDNNKSGDE